MDLEGADDAPDVTREDCLRGVRIDGAQRLVKALGAVTPGTLLHLGAVIEIGRDFGHVPALDQGPDVLAGTADKDGAVATCPDVGERGAGLAEEAREVIALTGIDVVKAVMRDVEPPSGAGFGGADVETPVDLPAVGADNLAAEQPGEFERPVGLAAGGGAHHGDQR